MKKIITRTFISEKIVPTDTEIRLSIPHEFVNQEIEVFLFPLSLSLTRTQKKKYASGNTLNELFGLWKDRETSLSILREKAWIRQL